MHHNKIHYILTIAAIQIVAAMLFLGCKENREAPNMEKILYYESLPSVRVENVETVVSDSGLVRIIVTAPLYEVFSTKDDPYWLFSKGIFLTRYASTGTVDATICSKYAHYAEKRKLWELRDSVVAHNVNNETFETELLFWDQDKKSVYTDKFIKITTPDEIITGYGFESNQEFSKWTIRKVTGTFKVRADN